MNLDYKEVGRRIAKRRKALNLKQAVVEERAGMGCKYLSSIERAVSIPSAEVLTRLALVLITTPDEFLLGAVRQQDARWKDVAQLLQTMDDGQLDLAESFLTWLSERD